MSTPPQTDAKKKAITASVIAIAVSAALVSGTLIAVNMPGSISSSAVDLTGVKVDLFPTDTMDAETQRQFEENDAKQLEIQQRIERLKRQ